MSHRHEIEQMRARIAEVKRKTAHLPPCKLRLITAIALAGAMAYYVQPLVGALVDYTAFVSKTRQIPPIDLSVFDRYNKVIDASREIDNLDTSIWFLGVYWVRGLIRESQERLKAGTADDLYVRELVRKMYLRLKLCTKPYVFSSAVYDYRSTEPFNDYYKPIREVYEKYISDEQLMMDEIKRCMEGKSDEQR